MLYETISQWWVALLMFASGCLSAFFLLFQTFSKPFKNKFFHNIFAFFVYLGIFFTFFLTNLKVNYGELRFFTIFAFVIGFLANKLTIVKFVAKKIEKCYNKRKEKTSERKEKMVEKS